jgi:hypothetical protein
MKKHQKNRCKLRTESYVFSEKAILNDSALGLREKQGAEKEGKIILEIKKLKN